MKPKEKDLVAEMYFVGIDCKKNTAKTLLPMKASPDEAHNYLIKPPCDQVTMIFALTPYDY